MPSIFKNTVLKLYLLITIIIVQSNFLYPQKSGSSYALYINNIYLPMDNKGILAEVNVPPLGSLGQFAGHVFLFSGGFFLSGYHNDSLIANGVAPSQLLQDYVPGTVASGPNDPKAQLYVVNVNDPPFGQSWIDWEDAVELGADFYDGNGDGIYNPADLNNNGQWDPDEDKPLILGDETVWCVYNDGVPANERVWNSQSPLGIEIRQTVYAFAQSGLGGNFIIIKYKIRNTGLISSMLDSVYFGVYTDPDIGDYTDDKVGSDIQLNSSFAYNDGPDLEYGNNPPAFFTPILYAPGNTNISSAVCFLGGDPFLSDPGTAVQARNFMLGLNRFGEEIDPCTFSYGVVNGNVDCDTLNNKIWFSGDPVTNIGWIFNTATDIRMLVNVGPFTLLANSDYTVITAYAVGQGSGSLESITAARDVVNYIKENVVTSIPEKKQQAPNSFILAQNYPNPFNPSTTIRYSIKKSGNVTLKIFDVLGRNVKTIQNGFKNAGEYRIEFNSEKLSSGIYYYQLRGGNNVLTKKMMVLK